MKSGRKFESKREYEFEVVEERGNLIVTLQKPRFRAVYYKPTGRPQLILQERTKRGKRAALQLTGSTTAGSNGNTIMG